MEDAFVITTFVLVVSLILSMAGIFQEVLPHLKEDDQGFLRSWFSPQGRSLGYAKPCPASLGSTVLLAKCGINMSNSFRKAANGYYSRAYWSGPRCQFSHTRCGSRWPDGEKTLNNSRS